jgi:hypothetical protein
MVFKHPNLFPQDEGIFKYDVKPEKPIDVPKADIVNNAIDPQKPLSNEEFFKILTAAFLRCKAAGTYVVGTPSFIGQVILDSGLASIYDRKILYAKVKELIDSPQINKKY